MNIFEIFMDWLRFRLGQKQRDMTMAYQAKARSAAFGSVKKAQDGLKTKLRKRKAVKNDDDD